MAANVVDLVVFTAGGTTGWYDTDAYSIGKIRAVRTYWWGGTDATFAVKPIAIAADGQLGRDADFAGQLCARRTFWWNFQNTSFVFPD